MKLGIIIPVRLSSKRLPKKALLKIKNKRLIDHVLEIAKEVNKVNKIIISTSKNKTDDHLIKYLKKKKIDYYRGDLNDVSLRFLETIKKNKLDAAIRLNGDSPLHSPSLINYAIKIFIQKKPDLLTNILERTFPKGLSVEIVKAKSYEKAYNLIESKFDRENISSIIYKNKNKFKIYNFKNYKNQKNLNLSVDTKKDLLRFKKIIKNFGKINMKFYYTAFLKKIDKLDYF